MTGFELPNNFIENPEILLRRVRPRVVPPQVSLPAVKPVSLAPSTSNSMAEKTLHEFSTPSAANVPVGPTVATGNRSFEIMTGHISMVHASPFCGKANEDANAHLQQFMESRQKLSDSNCFRFPSLGERNNGST